MHAPDVYVLIHLDDGSLGNYVLPDEVAAEMSSDETAYPVETSCLNWLRD